MKGGIRAMKHAKIFCKLLMFCVAMLLGVGLVPITSNAQELGINAESRMAYIQSYKVELTISDSGVASVTGVVTGKLDVTSTSVEVILQKYVSGDWVDVESWEESNNSFRTSIAETYQISKGTYRVVMTCSANTETKTATSAQRTYK